MSRWYRLCMTVGSAIFMTTCFAQDLGLLLGVRQDSGEYQSFWVAKQGVSVSIVRLNGPLWVKRGSEYWELGTVRQTVGNWGEDRLYATPWKKAVTLPELDANGRSGLRTVNITFASADRVGLDIREEGVKGETSLRSLYFRTKLWPNLTDSMTFATDFGAEQERSANNQINLYRESLSDSDRSRIEDRMSPHSWLLQHREGLWAVIARLGFNHESEREAHADVRLDVQIPPKIVERSPTVPDWTNVKSVLTDSRDFVTALDGSFVVVLAPRNVFVYGARNGRMSRQMGFASSHTPSVVSTQWFRGDTVRQMSSEVRQLQSSMPK